MLKLNMQQQPLSHNSSDNQLILPKRYSDSCDEHQFPVLTQSKFKVNLQTKTKWASTKMLHTVRYQQEPPVQRSASVQAILETP